MALIDAGIVKDEAIAAGAGVPAGKYRAQFVGLMNNDETGGKTFKTKTGGSMVKASFKVVDHPDPNINGKRLPIYNGVVGQFSFADLANALPFMWQGTAFDEEPAIGTIVEATVTLQTKGEYAGSPQLSKITAVK